MAPLPRLEAGARRNAGSARLGLRVTGVSRRGAPMPLDNRRADRRQAPRDERRRPGASASACAPRGCGRAAHVARDADGLSCRYHGGALGARHAPVLGAFWRGERAGYGDQPPRHRTRRSRRIRRAAAPAARRARPRESCAFRCVPFDLRSGCAARDRDAGKGGILLSKIVDLWRRDVVLPVVKRATIEAGRGRVTPDRDIASVDQPRGDPRPGNARAKRASAERIGIRLCPPAQHR